MSRAKKIATTNIIKFRPRMRGLEIPGTKCPLCGSPVILFPLEMYNALRRETPEPLRDDEFALFCEEICTNPECTHDIFRSFIVTVTQM